MLPIIFSIAGPQLSEAEHAFFRSAQPAGFILFNRNVTGREQVRRLTSELKACLGRDRPPILIDQEGGRVQMLSGPPSAMPEAFLDLIGRNRNKEFPDFPAAGAFGRLYLRDPRAGVRAAHLNARLLAAELFDCGITVNAAPVLDVPAPGGHDVIGDRALSSDAAATVALGRAILHGYRLQAVSPCIKHIPGHGRATADSHLGLPRVEAALEVLRGTDFLPFKELSDAPFAMTAHIAYSAFDPDAPATVSAETIRKAIRGHCGFQGVLLSDALEMRALEGPLAARALACVKAGCDAGLYCSGQLPQMEAIAQELSPVSGMSLNRFLTAENWGAASPMAGDLAAFRSERDQLLAVH